MFGSLLFQGLEILGAVAIILFVVFFSLRLINRRAGDSWWHLFRTKVGEVGDRARQIDPAKQMKQASLDAMDDLRSADEALIKSDQLRAKLRRQVDTDSAQLKRLQAQILQLLNSGTSESDPKIVDKAKRVRDLERAIAENTEQAEVQEKVYQNTIKSANAAAARIRNYAQEADRLQVQLDLGAETVKLQSMLQKYDPTRVNNTLNSVEKYRQASLDQLDKYSATSKVMADRSAALGDDVEEESEDVSDVIAKIRGTAPVAK